MKITFKNVGQGDSIILESNTLQMGIIDCKKYASINPTIEHIKASKLKEILFIALSHPHFDHYSGMLELLQYCETAEINVKYFIHTSNIHPTYLNWHEIEETQSKLLEAIFTKAIQLKQSKQIQYIGYATPGWQLKLGDEFTMQCLSPSDIECRNFTKQVDLFKDSNELKCSQAANLLSSVFEISNSNISFLLTADAEKQTFERLHNDITNVEHLKTQLVLVQVPHHGSANNHYLSFWKNLNYNKNCPAVISVGEHKKYNFPHKEVVADFIAMDYKVYATNHINGMIDFDYSEEEMKLSLALDTDSEIIEEYNIASDQSFLISANNLVVV